MAYIFWFKLTPSTNQPDDGKNMMLKRTKNGHIKWGQKLKYGTLKFKSKLNCQATVTTKKLVFYGVCKV